MLSVFFPSRRTHAGRRGAGRANLLPGERGVQNRYYGMGRRVVVVSFFAPPGRRARGVHICYQGKGRFPSARPHVGRRGAGRAASML